MARLALRNSELLLCDDFNIDLFSVDAHPPTADIVYRLYTLSLSPLITKPTRVTNHSTTLIDNIFSENSLNYRAGILSNDISDHFSIFLIKKYYFCMCDNADKIQTKYRKLMNKLSSTCANCYCTVTFGE